MTKRVVNEALPWRGRWLLVGAVLFACAHAVACSGSDTTALADGGVQFEEDGGAEARDGGPAALDGGPAVDAGPPPLLGTPIDAVYVQPRDGNTFLTRAIGAARTSVDSFFYIITDDGVERALAAAKRRGVRVRVMVDRAQVGNNAAKRYFADAGVDVRDSPMRFTNSHQKTVLVDGTSAQAKAFIMTLNPSDASFNDNREYAVEISRRAELDDMTRLFDADWNNQPDPAVTSPLVASPMNARARIENLIGRATQDVLVTVQVFTDEGVRWALIQRKNAGVRIRILLADPRDVDTNAQNAQVLKSYGLEVRFLRSPVLHAKLIIADNTRAYVGSVNLTPTSMGRNREIGVIIDQGPVVQQLRTQAELDWTAGTAAP